MSFLKKILFVVILGLFVVKADGMRVVRQSQPQTLFDLPYNTPKLVVIDGYSNSSKILKKEKPSVVAANGGVLKSNCFKVAINSQVSLYFPVDGTQPTTEDVVKYSCSLIKDEEVTEWYMRMFGWNDEIKSGYNEKGESINIIVFDKSVSGTFQKQFWDNFRRIAADKNGREILYRLIIYIRKNKYLPFRMFTYCPAKLSYKTCWTIGDGLCLSIKDTNLLQAFSDYLDYMKSINTVENQKYVWRAIWGTCQEKLISEKKSRLAQILSIKYVELFHFKNSEIQSQIQRILSGKFRSNIQFNGQILNQEYKTMSIFDDWSIRIIYITASTLNVIRSSLISDDSVLFFEKLVFWLSLAREAIAILGNEDIKSGFGLMDVDILREEWGIASHSMIWPIWKYDNTLKGDIKNEFNSNTYIFNCIGGSWPNTLQGTPIFHSKFNAIHLASPYFKQSIYCSNLGELPSILGHFVYRFSWSSTCLRGQGAILSWFISSIVALHCKRIKLPSKEIQFPSGHQPTLLENNLLKCPDALALCYYNEDEFCKVFPRLYRLDRCERMEFCALGRLRKTDESTALNGVITFLDNELVDLKKIRDLSFNGCIFMNKNALESLNKESVFRINTSAIQKIIIDIPSITAQAGNDFLGLLSVFSNVRNINITHCWYTKNVESKYLDKWIVTFDDKLCEMVNGSNNLGTFPAKDFSELSRRLDDLQRILDDSDTNNEIVFTRSETGSSKINEELLKNFKENSSSDDPF